MPAVAVATLAEPYEPVEGMRVSQAVDDRRIIGTTIGNHCLYNRGPGSAVSDGSVDCRQSP